MKWKPPGSYGLSGFPFIIKILSRPRFLLQQKNGGNFAEKKQIQKKEAAAAAKENYSGVLPGQKSQLDGIHPASLFPALLSSLPCIASCNLVILIKIIIYY